MQRELVVRLDLSGIARQRRHERADVLAFLEQHDALIGQDALHFVVLADDLAADAVERHDTLAAAAVGVAVNDAQSLGRAVQHVHERALIVQFLDRAIHLVEPRTRFLRRRVGRHDERDQEKRPTQAGACHRHSVRGIEARTGGCTIASGNGSDVPTTFECTMVRLKRDAYSPWCTR